MVDINSLEELHTNVFWADVALLDFWASWCAPCRLVPPLLAQLQAANPGLVVVRVNVDEQKALATAGGIRAIPTLILMGKGVLLKKLEGVQSLVTLQAQVDAAKKVVGAGAAIRP